MSSLCEVCDQSIIENESEYYNYLATLRKRNDKSLYNKYNFNNFDLDEVNKISNDYISTSNKKFDFYFIICDFVIEFDNNNNFIANIQIINCFYNTDNINLNRYLLYDVDCFKS